MIDLDQSALEAVRAAPFRKHTIDETIDATAIEIIITAYLAALPPAGAGKVVVPASGLIAIRDALVEHDLNEAYHQLYAIADPEFCQMEPWQKLESDAVPVPTTKTVYLRAGEHGRDGENVPGPLASPDTTSRDSVIEECAKVAEASPRSNEIVAAIRALSTRSAPPHQTTGGGK